MQEVVAREKESQVAQPDPKFGYPGRRGTITCDSDDGLSGESLCCCDKVLVLEANGQETLSPLSLSCPVMIS